MKIVRVEKGNDGDQGVSDSFMLPRDSMPQGLVTGEKFSVVLTGVITGMDEQGLVLKIEEPLDWRKTSRGDPLQDAIQNEINVTVKN